MRIAFRILACLLIGIGTVWILQGINILPGSFMTGELQWAYRGAAVVLGGIALLFLSRRRNRH